MVLTPAVERTRETSKVSKQDHPDAYFVLCKHVWLAWPPLALQLRVNPQLPESWTCHKTCAPRYSSSTTYIGLRPSIPVLEIIKRVCEMCFRSSSLACWRSLVTKYELQCFHSAIFSTGGVKNANKESVDQGDLLSNETVRSRKQTPQFSNLPPNSFVLRATYIYLSSLRAGHSVQTFIHEILIKSNPPWWYIRRQVTSPSGESSTSVNFGASNDSPVCSHRLTQICLFLIRYFYVPSGRGSCIVMYHPYKKL
ncbi:uncharacterized protein HD556DRAFT_265898 [Suillus plorans]|uniref:Uncharacterized protein n=1 Tax=Suillus plorans TaxID=116603 RepID=A0A9P7DKE5_9AGAM|nr:uncharacterized protein HD556DRAFT_265898 [Suillus plorans]KAG1797002.1 hypothetical protein HD556DRAFT_265898 [Suillus plorans]